MTEATIKKQVTLEVLDFKMDTMLGQQKAMIERQAEDHDAIIRLQGFEAAMQRRMTVAESSIDKVNTTRKWEGRIIAFFTAMIAAGAYAKP